MQMNGLAELITARKYYDRWSDPRLIVVVLHNDDLNQVTWEMRAMQGAPKFVDSQSLISANCARRCTRPRLRPLRTCGTSSGSTTTCFGCLLLNDARTPRAGSSCRTSTRPERVTLWASAEQYRTG